MKTIHKPWGKEVWLELNDKYCYKRIYIRQGYKTSFQYHINKMETNYIIDGEAEIWLEDDDGVVQKTIMGANEFFTVLPPKKHRVIAITDVILQEVSTPEVDDVIRIDDDTHRPDGKLDREHISPALCILSAGKGTRLGNVGKNINKGLLPVENKAVISHMIEKVSPDIDIIIATSHLEQMVKDYCQAAHPDRNITFVHVEHAEGPGSGPGKSLHYCKDLLQRPFYLATADCLIADAMPHLDDNWIGVAPTGIPELYSTAKVNEDMEVLDFVNKSKDGFNFAFIGLCGILDYELFWHELENNISNGELVDIFVDSDFKVSARELDWTDVGTIDNYIKVRNDFSLLKENEFIYRVGDKCIKFFGDDGIVEDRMKRAECLGDLVPNITFSGSNIYAYTWEEGKTLYEINSSELMSDFLKWYMTFVYEPLDLDISSECYEFYANKTQSRLGKFLDKKELDINKPYVINGKKCRSISEYFLRIKWDHLCAGIATAKFHGDLQFDNILFHKEKFTFLDWRHSFGGSTEYGDVYYDLAKLYGGILMPYHLMRNEDNFSISGIEEIAYSYDRSQELKDFQVEFEGWAVDNFDINRIKVLTALIYMNMSPLHSCRLGKLLYFQSQECLYDVYDG